MTMHAEELAVDEHLVHRLLARDLPELARLPVRRLPTSGSTNVLFGLGADLLVRLPRQPGGGSDLAKEARWGPVLAAALSVEVPEIVAIGRPGFGYPETWALTRRIAGEHPAPACSDDPDGFAADLVNLLTQLRDIPVPAAAQTDPGLRGYRAGPLRAIDADIRDYLGQCRELPRLALDLDACTALWDAAMALPARVPDADVRWVHADLLAENLLVRDGRLVAVLDLGALAIGDPSVDLVGAWELLDRGRRQVLRDRLEADELTWAHGRAWALAIALMTLPYYWFTMPDRCARRIAMARAVLDDVDLG